MQWLSVFYAFWFVDFLCGAPLCTCVHLCALVRRVHDIAHMHSLHCVRRGFKDSKLKLLF